MHKYSLSQTFYFLKNISTFMYASPGNRIQHRLSMLVPIFGGQVHSLMRTLAVPSLIRYRNLCPCTWQCIIHIKKQSINIKNYYNSTFINHFNMIYSSNYIQNNYFITIKCLRNLIRIFRFCIFTSRACWCNQSRY